QDRAGAGGSAGGGREAGGGKRRARGGGRHRQVVGGAPPRVSQDRARGGVRGPCVAGARRRAGDHEDTERRPEDRGAAVEGGRRDDGGDAQGEDRGQG